MRILQAHNRHAGRGGADHVMDHDRALLTAAGHEVEQWTVPSADESGMSQAQMALASVHNMRATKELAATLRRVRPDVLHVHTPYPLMSPSVFWTARRAGVPTVTTSHSYRYTCVKGTLLRDDALCHACVGSRLKLPAVYHRCYHDSLPGSAALASSLALHGAVGTFRRAVDRFLVMTDFSRRLLVDDHVPSDKITVKPNCVPDPGTPRPSDEREPFVLFVGRLVPEKGVGTLLHAWERARHDGARLVVAGDGPLRAEADDLARRDPSVELLGWCDQAVVDDLQTRALATVVTSEWYEAGTPLTLIQALAAGTPVVACDLDNVSETVREVGAGVTFRTGDTDDLARALDLIVDDAGLRRTAARAARDLYERDHTEQRAVDTLLRVYAEIGALRDR